MSASGQLGQKETTLTIRHIADSSPAAFEVVRHSDGKSSQPVTVRPPHGFPVEGRPNTDLIGELQWYLEEFLGYPYPPETNHAERVLKSLYAWGEQAFTALFAERNAARFFDVATADDYYSLCLQISSDDPQVLAWPWEALRDPEMGFFLAHNCQIERRLNTLRDAQSLADSLPKDRVNILLVVARPFGKQDVGFRSIARPLVELIEKGSLPAVVEVLRPPTFDRLRECLHEKKGFYHIVHFDGHGVYSHQDPVTGEARQSPEGMLAFETDDGTPDLVRAEKLSEMLRECAVPAVVLNACQSAMISSDGKDPFASVAMALLRAGMRDVVAMAYSLRVSGAQQFLPEFYRQLFAAGSMGVAVRAGRQRMWQHDQRVCARGEFPLQDWLVPVIYRQDPLDFTFAKDAVKQAARRESKLLEDLQLERNPCDFVGRDTAILDMERARRRAPTAILIKGLGGVGKTTLARGFLRWLDQTCGLDHPPFWLDFQEIRNAEYLFNRVGEVVVGSNFSATTGENAEDAMRKKIQTLAAALRGRTMLIVWDNFESAAGIAGTSIEANLPEADRRLLGLFLDELRGGATKVIITSRSTESWLRPDQCFFLELGGLEHEERWEYCNAILRDQGKSIDRNDKDLVDLMSLLGGHALAMRAILPRLETMSARQLLVALQSNLGGLIQEGDLEQARLYATLGFVEQSLPQDLRPALVLIGMHEGFVDTDELEAMAKQVDKTWNKRRIDSLVQGLVSAGLLRAIGRATYEMHPLLRSYLQSSETQRSKVNIPDVWEKAFVDVMGQLANKLAPLPLLEQRTPFRLFEQSLYHALAIAECFNIVNRAAALTQALASFAGHKSDLAAAQRLYERLVLYRKSEGFRSGEASAYHQLGNIARHRHDYVFSEECYRKALAINERLGAEHNCSVTYHQLGMLAADQGDFATAEQWYRKSLVIEEKIGNKDSIATSYHELGNLAAIQDNFHAAGEFYGKALVFHSDTYRTGVTYLQLGKLAKRRGNIAAAEKWLHKSRVIAEEYEDELLASSIYYNLGSIAKKKRDYGVAKQWYVSTLQIMEKKYGENSGGAIYDALGSVSVLQGDLIAAKQWYLKALEKYEQHSDEHGIAISQGNLGVVKQEQSSFLESGQLLIKAVSVLRRLQDSSEVARYSKNFGISYQRACLQDQEKLGAMWQEAGLGELPDASQPWPAL